MLHFIRSRSSGIVSLIILGLIGLSFVFFGLPGAGGGIGINYAAKVNGQDVSLNRFRTDLQRAENQFAQFYPNGIPDEQRASIRKRVLDGLILEELVKQRVYEERYRISDEALLEQIRQIPDFQLNGQFDREVYEQRLSTAGLSAGQFEINTRASMSVDQLRRALGNSAFVTESEMLRKHALENEKRAASYAIIPASQFKAEVNVSDEEIAAEYERTKASLLSSEQVDIEYIELTSAELAKQVEVNEDLLIEHYKTVETQYGSAEERSASHILINADDSNLEEKRVLAQSLLDQIRAGADFGELAKANSDDTGTAAQSGDLGSFGRDVMVPEFDAAVFAMAIDEISELVKTDFGFHIIKLTGIKESSAPVFAELTPEQKTQLESEYRNLQVEGILAEKAEEIANQVFEARDSLSKVAEDNGLKVLTQNNIERTTYAGIASNQVIKDEAFSDELRDGTNSDLIAVSTEQAVFLRVVEFRDVAQKTLDEVRVAIRTELEQKAASAKAEEIGTQLQAEVSTEAELKVKAEEAGYTFTAKTDLGRNQAGVQRNLVTSIFQAKKPDTGEVVERGVKLNNGDYAIYLLEEVKNAENTLSDSENSATMRALSSQIGNNELSAYVASLREKANIEIPKATNDPVN